MITRFVTTVAAVVMIIGLIRSPKSPSGVVCKWILKGATISQRGGLCMCHEAEWSLRVRLGYSWPYSQDPCGVFSRYLRVGVYALYLCCTWRPSRWQQVGTRA